jgi:hypothetical protein
MLNFVVTIVLMVVFPIRKDNDIKLYNIESENMYEEKYF